MSEAKQTLPADAISNTLLVPPQLVEAVQEDPELLVQLTRSQLVVVQDKMVRAILDDNKATVAQMAVVHERLSKNARIENKEGQQGNAGTQIVINFHRHSGRETVVVEGQATNATDVAPA